MSLAEHQQNNLHHRRFAEVVDIAAGRRGECAPEEEIIEAVKSESTAAPR